MLSTADRIAFSSQIVTAPAQIAGLNAAAAALQAQITLLQHLDTANENLFNPVNSLISGYQVEFSDLDGNGRTTIVEQDIENSANKIFQNHFFPNDPQTSVPSLAGYHNVWTKTNPYALSYAIGKNYSEEYIPITSEPSLISTTQALITIGLIPQAGTCSLSQYTTQVTCVANSGIWTPLLTSLTAAVNALLAFVIIEASIIVTNDTTIPNQAQNAAALNNINTILIPALNTWLATGSNGTNIGPLTALQTALNNRSTFITTRLSQLNIVLGSITQDIATGNITVSNGLYGTRYTYLTLRLNLLNGSLIQLTNANGARATQMGIIANITNTAATYSAFLPTSILNSPGNGTNVISVSIPSLFSVGDTVFIVSDNQQELQRAIKSINGSSFVLNDVIPAKYTSNPRIYKDLT